MGRAGLWLLYDGVVLPDARRTSYAAFPGGRAQDLGAKSRRGFGSQFAWPDPVRFRLELGDGRRQLRRAIELQPGFALIYYALVLYCLLPQL